MRLYLLGKQQQCRCAAVSVGETTTVPLCGCICWGNNNSAAMRMYLLRKQQQCRYAAVSVGETTTVPLCGCICWETITVPLCGRISWGNNNSAALRLYLFGKQ
ncbi:hypothetical protein PoB_002627900 [Plakobranchus ocellatus]|uniref:Uncharacterized protein n=1 Tax=Plakobranchus ocellatus TaxID=259542 RepID=A0AAV4A0P3_9GAST|nr:hypothetical protein PoB_002627900 [Plakobranchus ocellatus]